MHRLTFEECDERLRAGWHVELNDCCDNCSAQRKRYLRSVEHELSLELGPDWRDKIADCSDAAALS